MKKLLFTIAAMFAVLCLAGTAVAEGLCEVTATADCDSVTVHLFVPKGEGGSTTATIYIDGNEVGTLEFDGTDGEMTVPSEGTEDVTVRAVGTVTVGELTKDFDLTTTAKRDCATETTPPPSSTPPPTTPPKHSTPPPLAFTGGPSPLLLVLAVGLGLLGLGSLLWARRRV